MVTSARIVREGMGGLLEPPTHPAITFSVETDITRHRDNRGSMSLEYAAESDQIDPAVRAEAARILAEWTPLPLEHRDARLWVTRTFAYFHNCYKGPGDGPEAWHVDRMFIYSLPAKPKPGTVAHCLADLDPLPIPPRPPYEEMAAVHWVRKYYPEFTGQPEEYPTGCRACTHHVNAHANGDGGRCTVILDMDEYKRLKADGFQSAAALCGCPEFEFGGVDDV